MNNTRLRRLYIQVDLLSEYETGLQEEWKWNQINLAQRSALKILDLSWGAFILFLSEISRLISKSQA